MNRARNEKGVFVPTHGGRGTPLYRVWCAMKERCSNPHNKSFKNYGGRGISVCDEWQDFAVFREWAACSGYRHGLTIDRIDGNGNYSPDNCRWATTAEQNRNYRRNHYITYRGERLCAKDWAERTGIKYATILYRLKAGKTLDEVFAKEDGRSKRWAK